MTTPTPDGFSTESSSSGSPSGSTHPGSTGTVRVPPAATSGTGHWARQSATPHHSGAALDESGTTVSETVAGSERSPSTLVPSVTRYEKDARPRAPSATRTASR